MGLEKPPEDELNHSPSLEVPSALTVETDGVKMRLLLALADQGMLFILNDLDRSIDQTYPWQNALRIELCEKTLQRLEEIMRKAGIDSTTPSGDSVTDCLVKTHELLSTFIRAAREERLSKTLFRKRLFDVQAFFHEVRYFAFNLSSFGSSSPVPRK